MGRQAIVTKYCGPTDHRGSRVKAKAYAGEVTLSWDDTLDTDANHALAAKALAEKFGWKGRWTCGVLPDNTGNVYVCVDYDGFVVE